MNVFIKLIRFIVFSFLIAFASPCYSQVQWPILMESSKNSIEIELVKINVQCENAVMLGNFLLLDSLANNLLHQSSNFNFVKYKALAHRYLGLSFSKKSNADSAIFHYLNCEKCFETISDFQNLAEAEIEFGDYLNSLLLYNQAIKSLKLADSIFLVFDFKMDLIRLYKNLGLSYFYKNNFQQAIFYLGLYRKYAVMFQSFSDVKNSNILLANSYRNLSDFQSAIQFDLDLISLAIQTKDADIDFFYLNLAEDYLNAGDTSSSILIYNNLEGMSKNNEVLYEIYFSLGHIYQHAKKFAQSNFYFSKCATVDSSSFNFLLISLNLAKNNFYSHNKATAKQHIADIEHGLIKYKKDSKHFKMEYYAFMIEYSSTNHHFIKASQYRRKLKEVELEPELEISGFISELQTNNELIYNTIKQILN